MEALATTRRRWAASTTAATALRHLVLAVLSLLMAVPFLWMVLTALKSRGEVEVMPPTLLPEAPQWGNFAEAWSMAPFLRFFLNSAGVAGAVTLGVVFTALLAGYAFGQMRFPGKQAIFILYLATMMIPFEVIMIPNFLLINRFGWYDTYAALAVPWMASVFAVFLVTQFFRSLPYEYFEAAQLDGCGHLQYLWRVGRPLALPAMATAGLFSFLGSWNALLWPLLVTQSEEMRTIEIGLAVFMQEEGAQFHLLMAASTLAMAPVVALFLAAQRTFIEGIATGLKG